MIKVLFVCLGNICRSPAAEGIMLDLVKQKKLDRSISIDSAGTGDWHIGKLPDRRMRHAASNRGITLESKARQVTPGDLKTFDYIVAMDSDNLEVLKSFDPEGHFKDKLFLMTDFIKSTSYPSGVPDPYYGGERGFELVLDIVTEGVLELLNTIIEEHGLV